MNSSDLLMKDLADYVHSLPDAERDYATAYSAYYLHPGAGKPEEELENAISPLRVLMIQQKIILMFKGL